MDRDLKANLGKLVLDIAALNWVAAAKSGIDVAKQLRPKPASVARRATNRAVDRLRRWAEVEHIDAYQLHDGILLAERTVPVDPEEFAALIVQHGRTSDALAQAMLAALPIDEVHQASTEVVARRALEAALSALLDSSEFNRRLDAAAIWVTARLLNETRQERERQHIKEIRDRDVTARQLLDDLRRHSRDRSLMLISGHTDRAWHGNIREALIAEVRQPEAWRKNLREALSSLENILTQYASRSTVTVRRDHSVDTEGTYGSVWAELRNLQPQITLKELYGTPELTQARAALKWLEEEIRHPHFRTATLLTGRWGVGKSRVLAELAADLCTTSPDGVLILCPLPAQGLSFEQAIVSEARVATQRPLATLRDLTNILASQDLTAVVLADDFEQFASTTADLDQASRLIADSTVIDRIRWILSVDSWRLDRVLSRESTPRWAQFTTVSDGNSERSSLSGWLDLDAPNIGQRVGHALISRELGTPLFTAAALAELLDFALNAWLHIDIERTRASPAPTSPLSFDEAYWTTAINEFATTQAQRRSCRVVRAALERLLARSGGAPVRLNSLFEEIRQSDDAVQPRTHVGDALDALAEARLVTFPTDQTVGMGNPSLWAGGVARHLIGNFEHPLNPFAAHKDLQSFLSQCTVDFEETILMDVVGLLDWTESHRNRAYKLVRRIVADPSIRNSGVWAAAMTYGDPVRESVIEILKALYRSNNLPKTRATPHEAYLLLRLCDSDTENWQFAHRLAALRNTFSVIGANGIHLILHKVIDTRFTIRDVNSAEARSELLDLADGIESALSAREFSNKWAQLIGLTSGLETLLEETTTWLRSNAREIAPSAPTRIDQGIRDPQAPFSLHLADAVVDLITRKLDPTQSYEMVRRAGWLDPNRWPSGFGHALRTTCHVSLGHQYFRDSGGVRELLRILVSGSAADQESAIFVLRHTRITSGRRDIRVSAELEPFLEQLAKSNRLNPRTRRAWLDPMVAALRGL